MRYLLYFILTVLSMMLFSCSITKRLGEEEELLTKNKIEFNKDFEVQNASVLKAELATLYRQVPNEKWLFFFKLPANLHQRIEEYKKDSITETSFESALRSLAERRIAEPPAIFKESLMESTRKQMENYMQNRGYFDAKVTASSYNPPVSKRKRQVVSKKTEVTYYIDSKQLYTIDSIYFISKDPEIQKILDTISTRSYLKRGSPVDGQLYDKERNRITNTLRNKGYAFFTSNYIAPLSGDTTNFKTKVVLEVLLPKDSTLHKKYRIGNIIIYPNYNPILKEGEKVDSLIDGFHFIKAKEEKYWIKPHLLSENIFFKSGDLYQQNALSRTNRKLTDLGAFRFVNFRQELDNEDPERINFFIQITPRKEWEIGYDLEPNFTERNRPNSFLNLLGVSLNGYLGNKNLFSGAEQFSMNAFTGFEFDLGDNLRLNVIDLKLQTNIDIPRFTDYLGIYKGLNNLNLLNDKAYSSINDLAKTRVHVGYNFLFIDDFYSYHLFDAGWGFDYRSKGSRFIFNNLAIDLLRPNIEPGFEPFLDGNQFLKNSFGDQLFTGFLLRDFNYIWNKKPNSFGESYFLRFYSDISGGEIFGINKIYNVLGNNNEVLKFGSISEFSQYAKFEIDARYTRKFTSKFAAATRINIGIAVPYGYSEEVPYVKQFFVGGPQSIRAWGARGLGPGSFLDPLTGNTQNRLLFYQTGDFKFELNGELRRHLTQFFGTIEMAFFLDIGNVWTLDSDGNNERPGSVLQWRPKIVDGVEIGDNFFNEIAIGTGIGFRYDFDYFLLRFDLGYPVKNPYKTTLSSGKTTYLAYPSLSDLDRSGINYNLGMNYPF